MAQTVDRRLVLNRNDELALMRSGSVFEQVNALPGTKRKGTAGNRNGEVGGCNHAPDMSSHVIWPLCLMSV